MKVTGKNIYLRAEKLVSKFASFEAILVEVIFTILFFLVVTNVVNGRAPIEAADTGQSSLVSQWRRPSAAFVKAVYQGQDYTCEGATSCTLGSTKAFPYFDISVPYNVYPDRSSIVPIKSGICKVVFNGVWGGKCSVSWTWKYQTAVFPTNFGQCIDAGSQCISKHKTDNSSELTETIGGLVPARAYKVQVCSPTCFYGSKLISESIKTTGTPAKLISQNIAPACNGFARVNAEFAWNRAVGADYDKQYVDISFDANFASGKTSGTPVAFAADPHKLSRTDLLPTTVYYWRVNSHIRYTNAWDTSEVRTFGTPSCQLQTVTKPVLADTGAGNMSCDVAKPVKINFSWTKGTVSPGSFDTLYMDFSTKNTFAEGTYWPVKVNDVGATSFSPDIGFMQGRAYYWRVNYRIQGTDSWVGAEPKSFLVKSCTNEVFYPKVNCELADVTKDGLISSADQIKISSMQGPTNINTWQYDFNGDSFIDSYELGVITSMFGKRCVATGLGATSVCDGSGALLTSFKWTSANAETYSAQWVNWDTVDRGPFGAWANERQVAVGFGSLQNVPGLLPGKVYYFRVNTLRASDNKWLSSASRSFGTPDLCAAAVKPTNLVAEAQVPGHLSDGRKCSDEPFGVKFSWSNSGNWWLDVSENDQSFLTKSNRSVANVANNVVFEGVLNGQSIGLLSPPITFKPNTTYYWRLWYGIDQVWAFPAGPLSIPKCTSPSAGGTPFSQDAMKNYLKQTFANQTIIVPNACSGQGIYYDCVQNFGMFLYGLAGSESSWSPGVTGYGKCSPDCYGLFQYNPNTFSSAAATLGARTGRTYYIDNGWDQIEVTAFIITQDPTATAYTINLHWRADVDLSGREWNQFISDY